MNKTAGIDFGTSNTSIGFTDKKDNASMVTLLDNGSKTDTTCVFYSFEEGGKPIVGKKGFNECVLGERGRLVTSPKRFLKNNELPQIQILNNKFDLVDVISHILKDFKLKLEKQALCEIDSILVGRPVRFHDTDDYMDKLAENRLKDAFKKAGFKNIDLQFEPIGAFNAYSNEHPELKTGKHKVLVVDLGGGTSDFSLVDINNSGLKVLGNTGVYVGGDNIDERMVISHFSKYLGKGVKQRLMNGGITEIPTSVFNEFSDKSKLLFFRDYKDTVNKLLPLLINEEDKISLGRLNEVFGDISIGYSFHNEVEKSKILLTNESNIDINFNMFENDFGTNLSRIEFNDIIVKEVEQIRDSLLDLLKNTGVEAKEIDSIIMNGGTSFIQLIQTMVEDIIGRGKVLKGNSLSSVGYGLTLESYERFR